MYQSTLIDTDFTVCKEETNSSLESVIIREYGERGLNIAANLALAYRHMHLNATYRIQKYVPAEMKERLLQDVQKYLALL